MPTPAIFAWPGPRKNACWGAPQTRCTSGQSVQKSLLSAAPALPLLGLILPPVRQAEQMLHVALDGHQFPHLPLCRPVIGIEGLFLFGQLTVGFFECVHLRELGSAENGFEVGAGRPVKVLNLFGYTGGATLACAAAGATVCHVDASKGIVAWGKDNAAASGLADRPIRWLVDDCAKFVAREKRRGNTYDGIIMDPPSYGRGPGGEIWKLEDCIYDLISQCEEVLSDTPLFFAVNSYTTGLSPAVMEYMLKTTLVPRFGGKTSCDEIGLPVSATGGVVPCGATAIWEE